MSGNLQTATLAAGCFWCYEPIFEKLKGVGEIEVGYSGGEMEHMTFDNMFGLLKGKNNMAAEAFQFQYDPKVISFEDILRVFFHVHNPTTLNRQGNDVGPQYRSAIFYHTEEQKIAAEKIKAEVEAEKLYEDPIVTEITEFTSFYPAENYHQDFYKNNKSYPYCQVIIDPKIKKFLEKYESSGLVS